MTTGRTLLPNPGPTATAWQDRRAAAFVLPVLLHLLLIVLLNVGIHPPLPVVQDEFSYLLAGDTFAHGRLSNLPHPLWPFFEAVHVLQQPTYTSKFMPGLGLLLAFGQWLGAPIDGVCLCSTAAIAAIVWMLLGCLPPRWALIGGCVAAIDPLILYWANNFCGGELPLLGGALVLGVAVRLAPFREFRRSWGAIAGIGASLLLLSRPFEGGVVTLLIGATLLAGAFRHGKIPALFRIAPPLLAIVAATAGWLAFYDWRVTGSPWQLPYTLHTRQYMMAPLMFWQQQPPEPDYRHVALRHFYESYEWPEYASQLTWPGFFHILRFKLAQLQSAYLRQWLLMLLPWLSSLLLLRRSFLARLGWIVVIGLPLIHFICTPWFRIQYMSAAMSAYLLLITLGLQQLSRWRIHSRPLGWVVVALLLTLQPIETCRYLNRFGRTPLDAYGRDCQTLIDHLHRLPGEQLVFVRHTPQGTMNEIVYNGANIDADQTVFAHDMGDAENRKLIDYYARRNVWLLTMDDMQIRPYPPTTRPTFPPLPKGGRPS